MNSQLDSHLDAVLKHRIAQADSLKKHLAEMDAFVAEFERKYEKIVHPIFVACQESLRKRNLPVAIVKKRSSDVPASLSCELLCSDDPNDGPNVERAPKFRLTYKAQDGTLRYSASRILVDGKITTISSIPLRLSDLSSEKVNATVGNFFAAAFPL